MKSASSLEGDLRADLEVGAGSCQQLPAKFIGSQLSFDKQEEIFRKGLILEENHTCDEDDEWFALDFYRLAAEAGHGRSTERFNKLISKK